MSANSSLENLAMHAVEIHANSHNGKKVSAVKVESQKKRKSIPPSVPKSRKGRRGSRVNKGLRHFSVKVCEKLSQTGVTTYNEIANLLVNEAKPQLEASGKGSGYDEKNIRRRIYDALNVLMAMDIITKDKKKIRWKGIKKSNPHSVENVQVQKKQISERIAKKKILLEEMTYEYLARKHLLERNAKPEAAHHKDKLYRPFIIVNSRSTNDITCEMTDDRTHVFFNYSDSFSINDDHVILKEIGMQTAPELVPSELKNFLPSRFPSNMNLNARSQSGETKSVKLEPQDEKQQVKTEFETGDFEQPSYTRRRSTSSNQSQSQSDNDDEDENESGEDEEENNIPPLSSLTPPPSIPSAVPIPPSSESLDLNTSASLDVGSNNFDEPTLEIPIPMSSPVTSPVSPIQDPLSNNSNSTSNLTSLPISKPIAPLTDASVLSLLPTVLNPLWSASNPGLTSFSIPLSQTSTDWSGWPWTLSEWSSSLSSSVDTIGRIGSASTPFLLAPDLTTTASTSSNLLLPNFFNSTSASWSLSMGGQGTDAMSAAFSLSYLLSTSSSTTESSASSYNIPLPLLESSSVSSFSFSSSSLSSTDISMPSVPSLLPPSRAVSTPKRKRSRTKLQSNKKKSVSKSQKPQTLRSSISRTNSIPSDVALLSLAELADVSVSV